MTAADFLAEVEHALAGRQRERVGKLCLGLANELRSEAIVYSERDARRILGFLKTNRCFRELVRLGAVLSRSHPRSARIRRLYCQGLIDEGRRSDSPELLDQALALLEETVSASGVPPDELDEAWGLIGRIHKEFYLSSTASSGGPLGRSMDAALAAYSEGWSRSRAVWHGVNVVALLVRARRDGLSPVSPYDERVLAGEILEHIADRIVDGRADLWDYATAMEASLALDETEAAISHAETYVGTGVAAGRDEFEFASTLRQLREVWQLDPDGSAGSAILPMLDAVVLDRGLRSPDGGGAVELESASLDGIRSVDTFTRLERVFGSDAFVTTRWLTLLFDRLQAIGSVTTRSGRGVGTGFMVRGPALSAELEDDWYFVTNSHVVTEDESVIAGAPANHKPCRPREVRITFELLFEQDPREYRVAEVVWSSPPEECDVSILRLEGDFPDDGVVPYPVASQLPDPSTRPRLYIAGHPGGGRLQISMHDNHLIEFDDLRMQYRTPTNPGSSGSPVFNDEWDLVGVHHAGSTAMPRLDGSGGVHEANQGVRLSAILAALEQVLRARRMQ